MLLDLSARNVSSISAGQFFTSQDQFVVPKIGLGGLIEVELSKDLSWVADAQLLLLGLPGSLGPAKPENLKFISTPIFLHWDSPRIESLRSLERTDRHVPVRDMATWTRCTAVIDIAIYSVCRLCPAFGCSFERIFLNGSRMDSNRGSSGIQPSVLCSQKRQITRCKNSAIFTSFVPGSFTVPWQHDFWKDRHSWRASRCFVQHQFCEFKILKTLT